MVESAGGPGAVAEVRRRAGLDADCDFRMDAAYDDGQWRRLLAASCEVLSVSPDEAELALADWFMRDAQMRWPTWFAMARTAQEFLQRQPAIHNSFASGVCDARQRAAVCDKFSVAAQPGRLIVYYQSPNRLCGLYRALARCVLAHYGESASITELGCQKRGNPRCEIYIDWLDREVC